MITRALQSTYPAHCICNNLKAAGAALIYLIVCVCWRPLPAYVGPAVRMEQKADRHGQQKRTICDTHGLCQRNQSILKPVFHWFQQIHCVYGSVWCLDLDIWQFSWQWQTNRCCPQVRSCNYRYNYPAKCLSLFKLVWTSVGLRPRLEYIASMRASTCVAEPWQEEI